MLLAALLAALPASCRGVVAGQVLLQPAAPAVEGGSSSGHLVRQYLPPHACGGGGGGGGRTTQHSVSEGCATPHGAP
jgi:hypothetical protein